MDFHIPAGEEILACRVDYADEAQLPSVICLHGGGPAGMDSTAYLASALQVAGRTVIRFDFSGHGQSTGVLARSSLKKRLFETRTVLRYLGVKDRLSVIGTSMGGYIACKLASEIPLESLVLFCPAAYTTRAWAVPFGSGFTEIIRKENSFLESDILELLGRFSGNALYITGEKDAIIPKPVDALYREALAQCNDLELWSIEACPHAIHRWALEHPQVRRKIEARVREAILRDQFNENPI